MNIELIGLYLITIALPVGIALIVVHKLIQEWRIRAEAERARREVERMAAQYDCGCLGAICSGRQVTDR